MEHLCKQCLLTRSQAPNCSLFVKILDQHASFAMPDGLCGHTKPDQLSEARLLFIDQEVKFKCSTNASTASNSPQYKLWTVLFFILNITANVKHRNLITKNTKVRLVGGTVVNWIAQALSLLFSHEPAITRCLASPNTKVMVFFYCLSVDSKERMKKKNNWEVQSPGSSETLDVEMLFQNPWSKKPRSVMGREWTDSDAQEVKFEGGISNEQSRLCTPSTASLTSIYSCCPTVSNLPKALFPATRSCIHQSTLLTQFENSSISANYGRLKSQSVYCLSGERIRSSVSSVALWVDCLSLQLHSLPGIARRLVGAALHEAAKKREMRYSDLKKVERGIRRHFHDDITVVVVFLDHEMIGNNSDIPPLSVRGGIDAVTAPSDFFVLNGFAANQE
eukprot:Gb_24761 [translate_table: standard]